MPLVKLEKVMAATYMPAGRLAAAEFKLAVTVTAIPPGVNVPLDGETFNHDGASASDQFKEVPPEYTRRV